MPLTEANRPIKRGGWDVKQSQARELVRQRLGESVDTAWIARDLGLEHWEVLRLVRELDAEQAEEVARAPEAEVGMQLRLLSIVAEKMTEAVIKGRPVLDQAGHAVLDEKGHAVTIAAIGEARTLIQALQRRSKLLGIDAPDRSFKLSVNVDSHEPHDPPIDVALMVDAEYRRCVFALEQRHREIKAGLPGAVDVAGEQVPGN